MKNGKFNGMRKKQLQFDWYNNLYNQTHDSLLTINNSVCCVCEYCMWECNLMTISTSLISSSKTNVCIIYGIMMRMKFQVISQFDFHKRSCGKHICLKREQKRHNVKEQLIFGPSYMLVWQQRQ